MHLSIYFLVSYFLRCIYFEYSVCAQLLPILCDPLGCSLSVKFSRQEYWSGLPFLSLGDLSNPESLVPPALAGRFFTTALPGKPHCEVLGCTI